MQNFDFPDFPAYPAYKPSGVNWLGDIPAHWNIPMLKRVVRIINGATPSTLISAYWNGDINWITPEDLGRLDTPYIATGERSISQLGYNSCGTRLAPAGSVVMSTRAPIGHVAILTAEACVNQGCRLLIPKEAKTAIDASFLYYLLKAFRNDLASFGQGSTFMELSARKLGAFAIPLPPLPEQRAIAAYLDRKGDIARRYAIVARRIIANLRELRQVEIHDAVTRGLNEDAPLKPSGVEWLGDVPAHWDVCQVKRKYAIKLGKMLQNYPKHETDIAVPYLKVLNVQWAHVNIIDDQTMWASPRNIEQYGVRKGDLLVCEGGEGGRSAILDEDPPSNCIIQNALHRVRPLRDNSNVYLKYTMNAISTMGWFEAINNKATIAHFTVQKFSSLFIPSPPPDEQRAIAAHLDAQTAKIDAAIAHYERMAELVAEYWTVLVADAVTGRIDLRQTAPKLTLDTSVLSA